MDEDLHQGTGRLVQALLSFAKLWGRMWRRMVMWWIGTDHSQAL